MKTALVALWLVSGTSAFGVIGFGTPAYGLNQSEYADWIEATEPPNATNTVSIKPYSALSDVEFSWTVNVSEVAYPDYFDWYNGDFEDPRFINSQHSLSWPDDAGKYLNDTMPDGGNKFCVTVFTGLFPANVTDAYTADNANSANCTPALGQACVDALKFSTRGGGSDSCPSIGAWANMPECQGTGLGAAGTAATSINDRNATNPANGTNSYPLQSGSTFYYYQNSVYNGSNTTELELWEGKLQVMVISTSKDIVNGELWETEAFCMRASTDVSAAMPRGVIATSAIALSVMTVILNFM